MKRRQFMAAAGTAAAAAVTGVSPACAEDWPLHEITVILAVSPGGSADTVARIVARVAARELKVPVNVKNVLGGAGLTGFAELGASKPDGYTIGLVNIGGLLISPHIMQVPYTWDSFKFLGSVAASHYGIGVAQDSPIKTVDDIVALGKTRRVTYSASALFNGVCMIKLGNLTGAKFQPVITNTSPEAVAQAVGGHTDMVIQGPGDLIPMIESKQLRLIASTSTQRWASYPNVKTLIESGYNASTVTPLGFAGPTGIPPAIAAHLEQVIAIAAKDPELANVMDKLTIFPLPLNGQQFYDALKAEEPVIEAALAEAGMKKL